MVGGQSFPPFKLPLAGVNSPPKCMISVFGRQRGWGRYRIGLAGTTSTVDITAPLVPRNFYYHSMLCPLRIVVLTILLISEQSLIMK